MFDCREQGPIVSDCLSHCRWITGSTLSCEATPHAMLESMVPAVEYVWVRVAVFPNQSLPFLLQQRHLKHKRSRKEKGGQRAEPAIIPKRRARRERHSNVSSPCSPDYRFPSLNDFLLPGWLVVVVPCPDPSVQVRPFCLDPSIRPSICYIVHYCVVPSSGCLLLLSALHTLHARVGTAGDRRCHAIRRCCGFGGGRGKHRAGCALEEEGLPSHVQGVDGGKVVKIAP